MPPPTHLVSTVIHLHVVPVHVQLHVLVAEHRGWLGVSMVAGHVISQHQNDVTEQAEEQMCPIRTDQEPQEEPRASD